LRSSQEDWRCCSFIALFVASRSTLAFAPSLRHLAACDSHRPNAPAGVLAQADSNALGDQPRALLCGRKPPLIDYPAQPPRYRLNSQIRIALANTDSNIDPRQPRREEKIPIIANS
jgi:hypothetical protein